jgi:outer membrane protein TolC
VTNNRENYSGLIRSARRARRLADAGRLTEIQVDQAVQEELRARNSWISAVESYKSRLDAFKNLLGLPPDALIQLDPGELDRLAFYAEKFAGNNKTADSNETVPPADAPVELQPPDMNNAGPLEIEEETALRLAFEHRYDLMIAQGQVFDAQRAIVVLADALRADLTLFGSASYGGSRSIGSADSDDINLRADDAVYTALINLNLPLERTAQRNAYRNSYIALERAVRDVQALEDDIKISIRNNLRNLLESREALLIQAMSVDLAQKRVRSTNLFLEAGRAEIRDLLEAQESLLSAQNALTAAIINYRVAELELQRDMGVLEITENNLWQEYTPGEN